MAKVTDELASQAAWRAATVREIALWSGGAALLALALATWLDRSAFDHWPILLTALALAVVVPAAIGSRLALRRLAQVHEASLAASREAGAVRVRLAEGEKAELVGRLAAAVAHDVNNTLTVVVANAEWLAEEATVAEQREAAAQIQEAARHAAGLTQQMLVVSRRGLVQPRPVDLALALATTATALRRLLPAQVALEVVAPAPAWARLDPTQLHQLVLNLAMNARDAMPEGGSLQISARPAGDEVTLSVRDTGTGMDEATRASAFEPFFTTKGPGKGTGLGLANVKDIVAGLGGRVGLESALGHGTTVTLTLPACAAEQAAPARVASLAAGTGRVLVVDGDVRIRALVSSALLAAGYDVSDAPDGPTGLRLAARRKPDLLVADAVIPGLPLGLLVEGFWSANPDGRVLVITAYSDDEKVRAQVYSGELALLPKPFSRADLLTAVAGALQAPSPRAVQGP